MKDAHLTLPPPEEFFAAKNQFMELHGSIAVMNTYLKVGLVSVSAVCVGLLLLNFKMFDASRNQKPIVIRISEVGRAETINYPGLQYQPQEPEIRYFLIQFVHDHYGRM